MDTANQPNIKNVIDKIVKLRALSLSTNINEAANASAAAEKLIAEYRISEAELSAEKNISAPITEGKYYIYESAKITKWKSDLALRLASHYGVYIFNECGRSDTGRQLSRYKMIGRETDIQILQYNFDFLTYEIKRLCDLNCPATHRGISVQKQSYMLGAVEGIMQKLIAEKRTMESSASSAAMVVLNNKTKEARHFAFEKYNLKSQNSYSHSQLDGNAFNQGRIAGGNINTNSGIGGSSNTKYIK